MRTRNFRVRKVTKGQKGMKACVERKVGECFQWDSCSFSHEPASGNRGGGQRRKGQSSSPAPNSKAKTDGEGEKPSKDSGNRDEISSFKKSKIPCRYTNSNNPSCGCWHLPVCQNYTSKTGCTFGNECFFRHVVAEEKPSKKSKKSGAKGSVALL